MPDIVYIDGSYGEGGGQIIRTCLSLAVLTGKAVEICRVRAGRERPGLQPQHLAAVRAATTLCAAELAGAAQGSQWLRFTPRAAAGGPQYRFDIGTAGATTLVAQTVLVPLLHAAQPTHVRITGGTHLPFAPTGEYLEAVYLPALKRAGAPVSLDMPALGFYPRGGGELMFGITPSRLCSLDFSARGRLLSLRAFITTANLPAHVSERGAAKVAELLHDFAASLHIERRERPSPGPGAAVMLAAECEGGYAGFTAMGVRGKPMERVVEDASADFRRWWASGAACDEHLADQLVLPMAVADGESRWTTPRISEHLRTVLWVTEQFLPISASLQEPPRQAAQVTLQPAAG